MQGSHYYIMFTTKFKINIRDCIDLLYYSISMIYLAYNNCPNSGRLFLPMMTSVCTPKYLEILAEFDE